MTIAAGFVCSDGLLFASDTLYSGEERVSGDKFWTFSTDHVALVYGGAGTSTGLQCTINEIEHRLKSAMRRSRTSKRTTNSAVAVIRICSHFPMMVTYARYAISRTSLVLKTI
jgi:hypothetical protein